MSKERIKQIPGQSIRNTWPINPRTRVHDNDVRKRKKKQRQLSKNALKKGDFFYVNERPSSPSGSLLGWPSPVNGLI
jgi:hypothetical protein